MGRATKKRRPRRATKKMRRRRPINNGKPGLGSVVAKGVTNLIGMIPGVGTSLQSLTNFLFKAVGVSTTNVVGANFAGPVQQIGLVAKMLIFPVCIVRGSTSGVVTSNATDSSVVLSTNHHDGRVVNVTVSYIPNNIISKRSGTMYMSLQPLFNDMDVAEAQKSGAPSFSMMSRAYLSRSGSASTTLTLTYTPRVHDGRTFGFVPLDQPYAELALYYYEPMRATYTEFTADDFCSQVRVSGTVELRASYSNFKTYTYKNMVLDCLIPVGQYVQTPSGQITLSSSGYSCEAGDVSCTVRGKKMSTSDDNTPSVEPLSLDAMALDDCAN